MKRAVKILKEVAIVTVVTFILSNLISYIRAPNNAPDDISAIDFRLIDHSSYRYKKGKPLLVHFWATWCRSCKMMSKSIDALSKEYEVVTVAVNSGSNKDIKAYLDAYNLSFRVANDKEVGLSKRFQITAFPTDFIYDKDGKLRFSDVGFTSKIALEAKLKMAQ